MFFIFIFYGKGLFQTHPPTSLKYKNSILFFWRLPLFSYHNSSYIIFDGMEISANKKDAIENVDNYDVTNAVLGDNQRGTRFPPSPSN